MLSSRTQTITNVGKDIEKYLRMKFCYLELENIILSEFSHVQKAKSCIFGTGNVV
jgi:hypothetical protein